MGKSVGSLRTFAKKHGYKLVVLSEARAGDKGKYRIMDANGRRGSWGTNIRTNTVDSMRRILSRSVSDRKKADERRNAEIARIRAGGKP